MLLVAAALCCAMVGHAGGQGLSPALRRLEAPPVLAAAPDLDLSVIETPHVLTGLLKAPWSPAAALLAGQPGRTLRVDLMPLDCAEAPLKLPNGTLVAPASVAYPIEEVLPLLRQTADERGFHAYVRHLSLESFPNVSAQLPMARALRLAGPRLVSANLWMGDGGMRSNLHWDGHDNILLQLVGTKTLVILPPEATPELSYVPFAEHRYSFDGKAFNGYATTGRVVENHALFDAFDTGNHELPAAIQATRACVVTLRPGEALFLPALWSHAVVSTPAGVDEGSEAGAPQLQTVRLHGRRQARAAATPPTPPVATTLADRFSSTTSPSPSPPIPSVSTVSVSAAGLNMAVNLWFVQRSLSHVAALRLYPEWTQVR
jgi:hypothetical protein